MLSKETIDALKSALVKMGINLPAKPVVKLEDVALIDGSMLSVDAMEVGSPATFTGADGVAIPAEGEYELADGGTIMCAAGVITEIKPASTDVQPEEEAAPNAEMAAILSRLETIEKKYSEKQTSLEAQLSETKKSLVVALGAIETMNENAVALNMSLEEQKPTSTPIDFSKMSQFQKYQYAKYGKID
jgi:hypothetical protein